MSVAKLASVARELGLTAYHVMWVGLEGAADWKTAAVAAERDYVVVTNNRTDFLRLHTQLEIHNGLIIIVPTVTTDRQIRLFEIALEAANQQDSLVYLMIEVYANGTVTARDWPPKATAVGSGDAKV